MLETLRKKNKENFFYLSTQDLTAIYHFSGKSVNVFGIICEAIEWPLE